MSLIKASLSSVRQRILTASNPCQISNHGGLVETKIDHNDIKLVAVSKTFSANHIREAIVNGQYAFGENYVQEALPKIEALIKYRHQIEWHFIGQLQSNKINLIAENFDWVQSVDSIRLAEKLSSKRAGNQKSLNICIQVNISNEISKCGIAPDKTLNLAYQVKQLPHLCLRGLMAVPAPASLNNLPANCQLIDNNQYNEMANLYLQLKETDLNIDTLSLGMSSDLEQAIAAGSTMVRVGSAIFGQRH